MDTATIIIPDKPFYTQQETRLLTYCFTTLMDHRRGPTGGGSYNPLSLDEQVKFALRQAGGICHAAMQ